MPVYSRISNYTGRMNSMEIPLEKEEIEKRLASGKKIQVAFPELNADQREFIKSGTTPEEWDSLFNPGDY